ncbi:MAG: site-specific DNA-methyltransferase [Campylobacter sp.]|nr:site-specific DNA-methyltransferase [Campylobacter sp.]
MAELKDNSIKLIITSPPYFNIKDYSQNKENYNENDIGNIDNYNLYITKMLKTWKECERVLEPNGKLCINVPLMPMLKSQLNTHYNRHIYDLSSDIQQSILSNTDLYLMDIFIWNRTNPSRNAMFGSYPYPSNFYAQNTSEIKMYSFVNDIVLDTFTGSGTTLKVAKELNRNYIGYEIYQQYKSLIEKKIS